MPCTLTFSHLAYEKVGRIINYKNTKNLSQNDTLYIPLTITLKHKLYELPNVEIVGGKIQEVFHKKTIYLTDYDFYYDHLLLLTLVEKQCNLILKNPDLKNTLTQTTLPVQDFTFFKDCFNNIHLVSPDTAYQLYLDPNLAFQFLPVSTKQFLEFVYPCIIFAQNKLYFRQFQFHNQGVEYFYFEERTQTKKLLTYIEDKLAGMYAQSFVPYVLKYENKDDNKMAANKDIVYEGREAFDNYVFYKHILSKPIFAPLYLIRDSLFLFDHVNFSLIVFDTDANFIRALPITYHKNPGLKKEIIVDEEKQNAYAKFIQDGIVILKKIDLNTGDIQATFKLDQHIFPEKIKIKGGYAYYLYKNHDDLTTGLYRQLLE